MCGGGGEIDCSACGGEEGVACMKCHGLRHWPCAPCDGSGEIAGTGGEYLGGCVDCEILREFVVVDAARLWRRDMGRGVHGAAKSLYIGHAIESFRAGESKVAA